MGNAKANAKIPSLYIITRKPQKSRKYKTTKTAENKIHKCDGLAASVAAVCRGQGGYLAGCPGEF